MFGCTDDGACNFEAGATELDDSCHTSTSVLRWHGYAAANPGACNYDADAADDDSCVDLKALSDAQIRRRIQLQSGCDLFGNVCVYNYSVATTHWRRTTTRLPPVTTGLALCTGVRWIWPATTSRRPMWTTIRVSLGRVRGAMTPMIGDCPTSTNDSLCGTSAYFTNAEGRFGPTQLQCDAEYGPGVVVSIGGIQHDVDQSWGCWRRRWSARRFLPVVGKCATGYFCAIYR